MKKIFFIFLSIFVFSVYLNTYAQSQDLSELIKPFRSYKEIKDLSIVTPTVVEISFSDEFLERTDFLVLNEKTESVEPYILSGEVSQTPVVLSSSPNFSNIRNLVDRNTKTYADISLPESRQGEVAFNLTTEKPVAASSISVLLDDNVALPNTIEIRALVSGQDRIVLAKSEMLNQTVKFPKTSSNDWRISFEYGQPLRISEIRLNEDVLNKTVVNRIRFLAQPDTDYLIYFSPDRSVSVDVSEAGNLNRATNVLQVSDLESKSNPDFVFSDVDEDEVPDINDNCVKVYNPDQKDTNDFGIGDACQDWDLDGVLNHIDNCPNNPNTKQKDTDGDGMGDVCDDGDSRLTERFPWISWVVMIFSAFVLFGLLALTLIYKIKDEKPKDINLK